MFEMKLFEKSLGMSVYECLINSSCAYMLLGEFHTDRTFQTISLRIIETAVLEV